ncbi:transporter substrate-binding domain-containing protein, partial [Burkholderia gladioli]|uniref:transporter substrate-binding domain-containing protein n=1 Tax=Burkholderia gladioli TaxID=28095 RepID=UPI0016411263
INNVPPRLVARRGSNLQPTPESLRGKSVGVEQGSTQETYARTYWEPKGANFEFAGPPLHDPKTLGVGSAIGVRKDDDALRTQINQALASLIQDGTYQRIAKKYFSFYIYN